MRVNQKFCNIWIHASFWNKLQEFKGIELMSQSADSPDLAPFDDVEI